MTTQSPDATEQTIIDELERQGVAYGQLDTRALALAIAALPSNATTNAGLVEALEGLIVQATQVHQARMGDEDWDALEAAIADGTSALATYRESVK